MATTLLCLLAALLYTSTKALEFEMQVPTKCFYEEMNENVIAVVQYAAFDKMRNNQAAEVSVRIEDPDHTALHRNPQTSYGSFGFTAKKAGEYRVCFVVKDAMTALQTKLIVDWKTGVAAKDWDKLATKEHLDKMTVEIRKLEENLHEVYRELQVLRKKEEEMRDLNESTNERVAWYSIASLAVCILSGLWQLWYLKKFFTKKKLL